PRWVVTARSAPITTTAPTTRATPINSGDNEPVTAVRSMVTRPASAGIPYAEAAPTAGSTTVGNRAKTTHAIPASPIAICIVSGLSDAWAAPLLRGRARNPTPNALTNVATARPAVNATAATASG